MTDDRPNSPALAPVDVRWKTGWLGRDMARDCREPESEREWPAVYGAPCPVIELERFMADGGCGMAELRLRFPRVCSGERGQYVSM